jgi:alkanesulfonate monooxygenase SsuD/methylene tetrahydromethanopterin reductase-like flavin-dependent oxidoreductase (luciferase family)
MNERFGLLCFTDHLSAGQLAELAQELERTALESLWIPELFGREPLATAGFVIAKTTRIGVGTGIANVYARDALAAAQARRTLAELRADASRSLGVSHPPIAEQRGHAWIRP